MAPASTSARCHQCGFVPDAFNAQDTAGTLRSLRAWWDMGTRVAKPYNTLFQRPTNPLVIAMMHDDVEMPTTATPDDIHAALHVLHELGRNHKANGAAAPTQNGTLIQINVNNGGVPKLPVPSASVGVRGLDGDRQRSRQHHGRLWQAVCLQSLEAIERMQSEGHSIFPGAAGENLTIAGVDWESLRPNTRIHVAGVILETSIPALPCKHNAQWFSDGDFMRMHHERHRGETRWYATVIEPGTVTTNDPVVIEP